MTQLAARARALMVMAALAVLGLAGAEGGFYAWTPEGLVFLAPRDGHSIRSVGEEHFAGVRYLMHLVPREVLGDEPSAGVMFRWLTDEPLFLVTRYPERAEAYIASFDRSEFLHSWRLSFALESAMDDRPVTDLEILTGLGAPANRMTQTTERGRTERWEYPRYRLILYFSQGALSRIVTY